MESRLSILNPHPQKQSGPSLLHELVRTDTNTDRPALDFLDRDGKRYQTSYRELHKRSDALAARIHAARPKNDGSPPGRFIVPMFIGQCPLLYITQLAILKAGGAFCPIPLDAPQDRLRFILQDASASVLLTTLEAKDRLPDLEGVTVIVADESAETTAACPSTTVDPSMPAYVMYTSGSTGKPKGVLLSHSAATQALLAHDRHIPEFFRSLQFANPTFDVSVFEIFFPLFRGSTLVCCERGRMLNDLPEAITSMEVDAAELTPSVANTLLRGRESVPTLRVLLTIGEMLKQGVVEDFGGSSERDALLYGMYGPTEATIHCTLQTSFAQDMSVGNIGVPLDTVSAFVVRPPSDGKVREAIEILPLGEEGELAVGGYQLADGYLNRPEQTEAAFVPHPEFGRLYRTGDRVRLNDEGKLICSGRISSGQVKLRGQRIELGEIEYAASKTIGCQTAVADVLSGSLVVFCVPSSGGLSESQVQTTCKDWLPAFMIPSDVHILPSLPYLASGKVDRRALQHHHEQIRPAQAVQDAPENDKQTLEIAQVFKEVLQVDVINVPNLSSAGLDSLSSINIASRLRAHGFGQIRATDILEARNLKDVKAIVADSKVPESETTTSASLIAEPSIRKALTTEQLDAVQDIIACTPAQVAMLTETNKDPQAYCNWIELQFDIPHSLRTIECALQRLIQAHDLLRAGFLALGQSRSPYATVVWKYDEPNAIRRVQEHQYSYEIAEEAQLLRPRPIQVKQTDTQVTALLQLHHALYDQWSIDILKADLDTLLATGQLPSRPSFSAVAGYHAWRHGETTSDEELDFWQDHLRAAMPTVLPQLNGQKVKWGQDRTAWLPIDMPTDKLRAAARALDSSPHSVIQAAFAYLLAEYTGTSDVVHGTVFSGRQIPVDGIKQIFGPCLATLPSRVDLAAVMTFADLVRSVHDRNRGMLKHSEAPLAAVKKAAQITAETTLFDTLFVWQESTVKQPSRVYELDSADHHEFSLVLEAEPSDERVAIRVTYQSGRISSTQAAQFVSQLESVIIRLIGSPEAQMSELRSLIPDQLLSISNPQPAQHQYSEGLVATLEKVAQGTPSSTALVYGQSLSDEQTTAISYAELHVRANKLAHYLISEGVKPNSLVCVCMDKSLSLYVAILAVLKAGAGYLPIVPETPIERIRSALEQSEISMSLCDATTAEKCTPALAARILDVNSLKLDGFPLDSPKLPYVGSHAAYAIFTSGSTGTPKGLVVTLDNLLGNLVTLSDIYPVKPGDRLLQACSHGFDVSVFEIFFALFKGMALCFAQKDELFQDLERSIRTLNITHLSLTPTVAALVDPDNVPSVRFLVIAGEPMTETVHRRWAGKGLYQGYGPSETTNICTINRTMSASDQIFNIGPPLANTSAFVIDPSNKDFEILPLGSVGELAFGGEQVFRGYVGRPELNAEKIVQHSDFGRIYRSGDVGRMLPSGTILISGRLDDQVKIRGNRVELGEISACLLQEPQVKDCTTVALGSDADSQRLVTFFIPSGASGSTFEVLEPTDSMQFHWRTMLQRLESSLPSYMVPAQVLPVGTLPLTGQGKLDKRALEHAAISTVHTAYTSSTESTSDDLAEWTKLEHELALALSDSIGCSAEVVGRTASFSALGLNSINAIVYAKAIERRTKQRAPVSFVLRNRNIARLASTLTEQSQEDNKEETRSPVLPSELVNSVKSELKSAEPEITSVLPCTPLQEAMLSAGDSNSSSAYANKTTFKFFGDVEKLRQACATAMSRHQILRTRFVPTSDPEHPFVQVVRQSIDLPWSEQASQEPTIDASRPFHVNISATEGQAIIALYMHHAIYDGVSVSVLLEEIESLYRGQSLTQAPSFEPFLAETQRHKGADAMSFWASRFSDFSAKPSPLLSTTEKNASNSTRQEMPISSGMIDAFCKRHAVSALSIFQAAWAKLLSRVQRADDVCFGDVVSGRSIPVAGVERLVAPCFNTIPVRVDVEKTRSNIDLVRQLHEQRLEIEAWQLTPLRRIQALSKTPAHHLFDSLMLVQPPKQGLDQEIWQIVSDEGLMDLPLVLEVIQSSKDLELVVHSQTRYLTDESASQLAQAFRDSLQSCIRYPSSAVRASAGSAVESLDGLLASTSLDQNGIDIQQLDGTNSIDEWTTEEKLIRQAFSSFSGVEEAKISRGTSLFRLGLDSLNAVQIVARLRSQGLSATAADILEHRTPSAIAQNVRHPSHGSQPQFDLAAYDKDHRSALLKPLNLESESVEALRPCTPAQNGMLAQSLQSKGKLYVNHVTYAIPEGVEESDLRASWEALQRRHQALRMGFCETDEAKCPFALIVHHHAATSLPLTARSLSMSEEESISTEIIESLHLPAWRLSVSLTDRTMTVSIHHALYDAESLQILVDDLVSILQNKTLPSLNSIDALLSPMIAGAMVGQDDSERFWRDALQYATATAFPNLQPAVVSHSALESVHLSSSLSAGELEDLCKAKGCTIQSAGQSAWAIILAAYLGDAGVTFGTVFSGRTGSKHESIIFPSLTTVPVFCNTAKTSDNVLADMINFNSSAQRHRFAPLSDIQRFANCTEQSLFDTVFVCQKALRGSSPSSNWSVLRQSAAVDYNVSLEFESTASGEVLLTLTSKSSVMPAEHAHLILRQYDHVLSGLLQGQQSETPDTSELYSITPAPEPTISAPVELLHQFVERGAIEHPYKPALEFAWRVDKASDSRQTWTYRQLNGRANQVAQLLTDHNVKPGSIVAVCMHKSPEASFAFIGILKAGCAFLALDPELPLARRHFVLEDSHAALLFVDKAIRDDGDSSTATVALDDLSLDAFPASAPDVGALDPQSTCYCLYTSGTTGAPKGCELTHENAVQAMMSFQRLFAGHWSEQSRWLQFASYWFDVSVLEQFWSWSVGITVVGAPRDLVLGDLTGFIQALQITHIDLTPSLARLLEPEDLPSLWNGVFITGGEALKQEIIQKWGNHQVICNGYGPTEATIGVTMNPFVGADAKPANIGRQFDNVGSYVFVPGTTEPVLRGAIGELCVSGKLVGKGYLNREELTAKQFPVVQQLNDRVYRTGDVVRQLIDGSFSFAGRQDSQAKLRGQRLEIDEIDSVVRSSSNDIADVASLVVKSSAGDKETLVTFFVTSVRKQRQDIALDISPQSRQGVISANNACRAHLPGYMIPTHMVPLNIIPLNVNNKTDGKRLAAYYNDISLADLQSLKSTETQDQRFGEHEQQISEVLGRMLSIDASQLSRSTNLFSLGLSSVSAISFASLLKKAGFKNANVGLILRNADIGKLADALAKDKTNDNDLGSVRQAQMSMSAFSQRYRVLAASRLQAQPEDIELGVPCTPLQQGLILESSRDEHRPYFNSFSFHVESFDIERLRDAFQRVADRVQVLRTKFFSTDEGHAQIILRKQLVPWTQSDCNSKESPAVISQSHNDWISRNDQDLVRPFEVLVTQVSTAPILTIFIHHALYDGISFDLLMGVVEKAYNSDAELDIGPQFTDALPFGPLRPQNGAQAFWTQHLPQHTFQPLPFLSEGPIKDDPILRHTFEGCGPLENARKHLGVSHQAIAQACFAVALHQVAPATSAYGTVVSGRSMAFDGADKVIGPLFNTLPAPLDLRANLSWSDLVQRIHEFNVALLPFQHTPLREVKKWTGRKPSDLVFDVLFVFQNLQATELLPENKTWDEIDGESKAEYPLAFELELGSDRSLTATLVAKRENADHVFLQTLLDNFGSALQLVEQQPHNRIGASFKIQESLPKDSRSQHQNGEDLNGVYDFQWTPEAKTLRAEIARLAALDERDVDEHATMFSLGLDSIDAVKLVSRLKKVGLPITVSKLLRAQTLPRILQLVERQEESSIQDSNPNRLRKLELQLAHSKQVQQSIGTSMERVMPATPSQEALVAEMLRSGFREYYNHDVMRISEQVNLDRLERALNQVLHDSPVLRASFFEVSTPGVDTVFAQAIHHAKAVSVQRISVRNAVEIGSVLEHIREEARATFETLPPTRVTLVNAGSEDYLIISLAHAQYDGHSLALVHQDIERAYWHEQPSPRPSADFAIDAALTSVGEESLAFWKSSISGAQVCKFPTRPKSASTTLHHAELRCTTPRQAAQSLCQKLGISLQSLAQTCWALTLAHYTRRLEVLFGIVLACRDSEEAEQIMFPMMNTVVMRAALHGTRADMLRYIQSVSSDMLPHQRTPLRAIQNACAGLVKSDTAEEPNKLFDTIFIYQNRPESKEAQTQPLYESVGGSASIDYPVAVEMEAVEANLVLRASCKDIAMDHSGTEDLLQKFDRVLDAMVSTSEANTVEFTGSEAVICGLSPVQIKHEAFAGEAQGHDNYEAPLDLKLLGDEAVAVKDALCQVAKTSPEEVSSSSTIESIGIDSISAIKVVALLRKQNIKLSVSQLLSARSFGRIAQAAVAANGAATEFNGAAAEHNVRQFIAARALDKVPASHGVDQRDIQAILPATPGQVYTLSTWQASDGHLFYPTFTYSLNRKVNIDELSKAWETVVRRRDILRTVFCASNTAEAPVLQAVLRGVPDSLLVNADGTAHQQTQPMVRLEATEATFSWKLKLTIHHALYDAVSLPLIVEDLQTALVGKVPEQLALTQADFLAPSLDSRSQASRKAFWTQYLRDARILPLHQQPQQYSDKRVEIFKPTLLSTIPALETLARSENISIQSLLFATYARVYAALARRIQSRATEGGDVVLGIYLSNRSHLDNLTTLRSPTLNLVPLLVREAGSTPLVESAKQIHADLQVIGSPENSAVGLWEIHEWTGIKVDCFINYLRQPETNNDNEDASGVSIVPQDESRLAERAEVVILDGGAHGFEVPKELQGMKQLEVYQPSLDIETAISGGKLDMGLFCPDSMLGLQEAEEVFADVKAHLEDLFV